MIKGLVLGRQGSLHCVNKICKSREISKPTKLCIIYSNVKVVLMYGSEMWCTTKSMLQKIQKDMVARNNKQ